MPQRNPQNPILLVDDEPQILLTNKAVLLQSGYNNTETCNDSRNVISILKEGNYSLVLLDLRMPYLTGEELLPQILEEHPDLPVIVITGANDIETAVNCMKAGAFDFMVKPVDRTRLATSISLAIKYHQLQQENTRLSHRLFSKDLECPEYFEDIVTRNGDMLNIFRYMETVASSPFPLLITGETGVGKELIARAFHQLTKVASPMVTVNVASLDHQLFSDSIFGHVKGAFSGATQNRPGLVEKASNSSLFLDEIGDLDPHSQVKLLRLIQEGEYMPLGSDNLRHTNARIILATNRNLDELQRDGQFRKDLYYRLKTHHVHLPPLRKRKDDIPLLLDHFIERTAQRLGKAAPTPVKELIPLLNTYSFPGNIREFESMVVEAVTSHQSHKLTMDCFKAAMQQQDDPYESNGTNGNSSEEAIYWPVNFPTLNQAVHDQIKEALKRAQGNQTLAARLLGITPSALSQRLKKIRET